MNKIEKIKEFAELSKFMNEEVGVLTWLYRGMQFDEDKFFELVSELGLQVEKTYHTKKYPTRYSIMIDGIEIFTVTEDPFEGVIDNE